MSYAWIDFNEFSIIFFCSFLQLLAAPAPTKKEEPTKKGSKKEDPKKAAPAAKKEQPKKAAAPQPPKKEEQKKAAPVAEPPKTEKDAKTVKAVAAKPAPKKRGVNAKAAAAAGKGRVNKKQVLRGKGLKKKKIQLRFAIDCTNIAEDSIMDVADFVSVIFHIYHVNMCYHSQTNRIYLFTHYV